MIKPTIRTEKEIFSDLEKLCKSPGYIHAIAYFCWDYNFVKYTNESNITIEEFGKHNPFEKLIRNELSILIGLLVKNEIDFQVPKPEILQKYLENSKDLLEEIHSSMVGNPFEDISLKDINSEMIPNPFSQGKHLREAVFYGTESAYSFQYIDFAMKRYSKDDIWIQENKGFSINDLETIIRAINGIIHDKMNSFKSMFKEVHPDDWTMLPIFTFRQSDIVIRTKLDDEIINNFINAFTFFSNSNNDNYQSVDDLNQTNIFPILQIADETYILFQQYTIAGTFYESPFYWFLDDKSYKNIAMKNRGDFTEDFTSEKLKYIFGDSNVFTNVDIIGTKNNKIGEIDILVLFANKAIVVQAKSKKLTVEARKGNDIFLEDDFKKAVQGAYDQGYRCAEQLILNEYDFIDGNKNKIDIPKNINDIYIFCITSEHYPALSIQSMQFLEYKTTDIIKAPFVMDIFLLDALAEMLQSPLFFLSYIDRRTFYGNKIVAAHELTVLAYHLSQNLWFKDETMIWITDDVAHELDLVMYARRTGVPANKVPSGILKLYTKKHVGNIVRQIELIENTKTIDFGLFLLQLGTESLDTINDMIEKISKLARSDGKNHDFVLGFKDSDCGITVHCNYDTEIEAMNRLNSHCRVRKYSTKFNTWFGICLHPDSLNIRFGITLDDNWKYSYDLEKETRRMNKLTRHKKVLTASRKIKKLGRNDPCLCGSGRKYKKCCL